MAEKIEGSNILNLNRDYKNGSYIFLGEPNGLYDTVHCKHPFLKELFTRAISQNWRSDEFDFTPCLKEFARKDDACDIMLDTIGAQWEMDSSVANALMPLLAPFITDSDAGGVTAFNTYMECLTPEHEVFIKGRGWVSIRDVSVGEEILQFTKENKLVFGKIQHTIAKENSEDHIYILKDKRHFEQHVTPNHRIPFKKKYQHETNVRITEANKLNIGDKDTQIFLSGRKEGTIKQLTCYDRFWIAFQADGHKPKTNGQNGVIPITFNFKKDRKSKRLESILEECGYEYAYRKTNGYDVYHVRVPLTDIRDNPKGFGWVNLDEIDYNWALRFVDEVQYWDGHTESDTSIAYYNSRFEAINVVQTIAAFGGFRTKLSVNNPGDNSFRKKPCYTLYITERHYKETSNMSKETIPYTGMVYCVTVEHEMFLTRINNRISVTANCVHAESYSEITRNGYPDPEEALEKIVASAETFQRFSTVVAALHELSQAGRDYVNGLITKEQAFPILYKGMTAIYLLERINFIASFAITFGLGEMGMFLPIANCVKKICADEIGIHSVYDEYCLRHMREDMHYWQDWKDNKEFQAEIIELIDSTERDEERWTDFIFKDRTIVGLTPELVKDWVRFNVQMLKQSMDLPFEVKVKENPLPWMNNWLSLNKFQNAPQEIEKSDYAVGAMRDDLDDGEDFDV